MGNATGQIGSCSDIDKAPPKAAKRALTGGSEFDQASFWHEKMRESKPSQELFDAAAIGDVKGAMTALVAHGNPNCCNAEGLTSLMMSCAGGHLEVARLLVTSGARVNAAPSPHGLSPIGLAAAQGCTDIVRLLLQWKADANVGRVAGNAPLSRAAAGGHLEVCVMLLDHGASLDAYDERGVTPVMHAVEREHLEVTQLLLQRNSSMARVDRHSLSALHRAVEVLLRMEPRGQGVASLRAPMDEYDYWAELIRIMAEARADPNAFDAQGETLLCRAIRRRRKDVLTCLLDVGATADLPVASLGGGTGLLLAAEMGERDLCQALVMRAAAVNQTTAKGVTPLAVAIDRGDEELCFYLVQCNADFNRRDPRDGQTLLMRAAAGGLRALYDRLQPHVALDATDPAGFEPPTDDEGAEYEYVSEEDSEDGR